MITVYLALQHGLITFTNSFYMKLMIWVKVHAYVKLVEIWNIYDTALSIIFPVGFFISFCCVTLRFIFWKLHFYKHKPLFPEEQILLFVILFLFCLSLLSPLCLSLPPCHKYSLFFSPSTASSSCLVILMYWVVFFLLFFCVPSEWTTPKVLSNSVPVIREGSKGEVS